MVCTHEGLLQALSSEADPAALTFLLRFAAVLFGSTPYQRLPPTLLPGTLQVPLYLLPECIAHPEWHLLAIDLGSFVAFMQSCDSGMRMRAGSGRGLQGMKQANGLKTTAYLVSHIDDSPALPFPVLACCIAGHAKGNCTACALGCHLC